MKKLIIALGFISLSFWSCEEIMPVIPEPTPPEDVNRKVIIEEFTGVTCVQCPAGSAEIENLLSIYGENLIAISIHAGFFAEPHPEYNQLDLRTPEGTEIQNFLGAPVGYPAAVINRTAFDGQFQQGLGTWAGIIDRELQEESPASLILDVSWDESTRRLDAELSGVFAENMSEEVKYSVLLTESGVIDGQLTPNGWDLEYNHKHVLRDFITDTQGNTLREEATIGEVYQVSLGYTVPEEWDINKMELVAFLHGDANNRRILQVESHNFKE